MDPDMGLTGFDFADCEFKKAVIAQSNQSIVVLTIDKLPGVARFVVAKSRDIDVLVVEEGMDKDVLDAFTAQDVRIVCA
jgi:DeoR/GlpR family transcriptional regulator of sugar metabolism